MCTTKPKLGTDEMDFLGAMIAFTFDYFVHSRRATVAVSAHHLYLRCQHSCSIRRIAKFLRVIALSSDPDSIPLRIASDYSRADIAMKRQSSPMLEKFSSILLSVNAVLGCLLPLNFCAIRDV